jgi:trigger factor
VSLRIRGVQLEYTISKEGKWRTLVAVNIEAEKVEPELTKTYEEYQKSAKVEGFRKGKIPLALVKKMFGKTIESKVFTPHISEAWKKVFEENEFDIIDEPSIENIRFADLRDSIYGASRYSGHGI